MLTSAVSVRRGVKRGISVTFWPARRRAEASVLSRRQLPQYIPAAPAARIAIFTALGSGVTSSGDCRRRWAEEGKRARTQAGEGRVPHPLASWRAGGAGGHVPAAVTGKVPGAPFFVK